MSSIPDIIAKAIKPEVDIKSILIVKKEVLKNHYCLQVSHGESAVKHIGKEMEAFTKVAGYKINIKKLIASQNKQEMQWK